MARSMRGPRLCGIPLTIHPSWLLAIAIVVVTVGGGTPPGLVGAPSDGARLRLYLGGLVVALGLFGSVLLHELAHAVVARRCALPVRRITMFFFGGTVEIDAEALSPRGEALIGTAGPLVSGGLTALFGGLWWAARGTGGIGALVLQLLALANGVIALLAILPGYPLDGGRILRALLWYITDDLLAATRLASLYGQGLGWCLIGGGAMLGLNARPLWGAGFVLCGWFLRLEARRGYRDLLWRELGKRIPTGEAAFLRPPRIPAARGLDEAVGDVLEGLGQRNEGGPSLVVDDRDRVVGVLGLDQIRAVKRSRWPLTTAGQAMLPLDRVPALPQDLPLGAALAQLSSGRHACAIVVADPAAGAPAIGVVTPARIIRYLARRIREDRPALDAIPASGERDGDGADDDNSAARGR